jgi:hypothetical protein
MIIVSHSGRFQAETRAHLGLTKLHGESPSLMSSSDRRIVGFACHDPTCRNFFGPTAVKPEARKNAIGTALLLACLGRTCPFIGVKRSRSAAHAVLTPETTAAIGRLHLQSLPALAGVTAVLSNVVSNVPAVLVLKPFVAGLQDPQRAWLVVAMGSTFAGNLTLVGSVANLIVAQRAHRYGVAITFWPYFKVGAPLTLLTILFGLWWL